MLKDLIQAGRGSNYRTKRYIGSCQVISKIVYHALGMTDNLIEVPNDEHEIWEDLVKRREVAHRET